MIGKTRACDPIRVAGVIAGRDLWGVHGAQIVTDGTRVLHQEDHVARPYTAPERASLIEAMTDPTPEAIQRAAEVVETACAEVLAPFEAADLFGFQGLVLRHAPKDGVRVEVGDGRLLAAVLGRRVVWDFARTDMELGGVGGPLGAFHDFARLRQAEVAGPQVLVHLGAVTRLSLIDPRADAPDAQDALRAFHCGPGGGVLAPAVARGAADGTTKGRVHGDVVEAFLSDGFFARMPPKTCDIGDFDTLLAAVSGMNEADRGATLRASIAAGVARGLDHCLTLPDRLVLAGAGRLDTDLVALIEAATDLPTVAIDDLGCDGAAYDAQGVAFLAARVARGLTTTAPGTSGVGAAVGGGTVSAPHDIEPPQSPVSDKET